MANWLLYWTIFISAIPSDIHGQCTSRTPYSCEFACNCREKSNCPLSDSDSGCGPSGCEKGKSGKFCQRYNVAYRKRSTPYGSHMAFDGLLHTVYDSGNRQDPYLQVELYPGVISMMKIRTSGDIRGFRILFGNTSDMSISELCYQDNSRSAVFVKEYNIQCRKALVVRYVRIQMHGIRRLIIPEMEIYRCGNYWFGDKCDRVCNCRRAEEICHKITGQCTSGCSDGFTGTDCYTACPRGRFGKECGNVCHCKDVNSCNKVNGMCDEQDCAAGYKGHNCQEECDDGLFGNGCASQCKCREKTEVCNKMTGFCASGCPDGLTGTDCHSVCPRGQFGKECGNVCHCKDVNSCNKVNGICDEQGCAAGYKGHNCQEACQRGQFGDRCQGNCHCKDVDSCDKVDGTCNKQGCAAGYKGDSCQEVCPRGHFGEGCQSACHCENVEYCDKENGTCDQHGCAAGYKGYNCQEECQLGLFGEDCKLKCHCKNVGSCNKADGTCDSDGCAGSYKGDNCQEECSAGEFGEGCLSECHCKDEESCDKVTGQCGEEGCAAGYKGDTCQNECEPSTYGENCLQTCGRCMGGEACNKANGSCLLGCEKFFTGERCQEAHTSETSGDSVAGAAVGAVLGILFVVMLIAIIHRRVHVREWVENWSRRYLRRSVQKEDEEPENENCGNQFVQNVNPAVTENDGATYANTGDVSLPPTYVHARNLLAFVNQKLTADKLSEEFEKLPLGLVEKTHDAKKPYNVKKCRYKGILPYDHTRVHLTIQDGDPTTDFINASYINGYAKEKAFIASQGPTSVNIVDFWRMVWEKEVGKIVMVARQFENGKLKVLQYWPEDGASQFGDITVVTMDTQNCIDHIVRQLKVHKGNEVRKVIQFHYLEWPDHGAPRDTPGIIALREKVNKTAVELHGPVIVHCSAGVGRTGTFIAFDYLMRKLEAEQLVDIFQTVVELRHQRAFLVQNKDQYVFLHKLLRDAYICRGSCVTTHMLMSKRMHSVEFTKTVEEEYKKLEALRAPCDESLYSAAWNPDNQRKNRDLNCVPADIDRIWLSTNVPGRNDYVNAMFVPADRDKKYVVTTQMPFGDTRIDFWRLVYEQKSTLIVLLSSLTEEDNRYWPTDKTPLEIGPFTISLLNTEGNTSLIVWTLSLTYNGMKNEVHQIRFCCFTGWLEGQEVPSSPRDLIHLQAQVQKWQSSANAGPVIIHCRNGTDHTCLYCTVDFLLDHLKHDSSVDILMTAKRFRAYFHCGLKSQTQYHFCYLAVGASLDDGHTYANSTELNMENRLNSGY